MLKTFSSVTPLLKLNQKKVKIDNFIFKLHYRWTFIILLGATLLVTSRQYIGEHIKCISDTIPERVINTFCFFTPTFTLVRHLNNTGLESGAIFQPGIGPYESQEEPIKRHAYYQWVPFVLFGQALCFYVPHLIWKKWEGGRIKALVYGLKMVGLTRYLRDKSLKIGKLDIPSIQDTEDRVQKIRRAIVQRMQLNQSWGIHLVLAEVLNLFNILLQIHATDCFLNGAFYTLGFKVMNETWTKQMDELDVIFPKVTKCHFHKYGAGGSLQMHDTLCVMALNIINEKIFTILWFWYFFVLIVSVLGLVWRIFTLFLFKSKKFSCYAFSYAKPGKFDRQELCAVIKRCNFSNWMFLYFLASNLSEFLFKKVIFHLADELSVNPNRDNAYNDNFETTQVAKPSNMEIPSLDTVDSPLLVVKLQMEEKLQKTE